MLRSGDRDVWCGVGAASGCLGREVGFPHWISAARMGMMSRSNGHDVAPEELETQAGPGLISA
jgi:hypothetical protein